MSGDRLPTRLGPDLAALAQDVGVPLARATQITGLRSSELTRATFRLDFRDGRRLKGRRFDEPADAARVETLAGHVNLRALPHILSRRGSALLEEWVLGASLDRRHPTREHLRRAGALLGAIHRTGAPVPPGAKTPPTPAERLVVIEQGRSKANNGADDHGRDRRPGAVREAGAYRCIAPEGGGPGATAARMQQSETPVRSILLASLRQPVPGEEDQVRAVAGTAAGILERTWPWLLALVLVVVAAWFAWRGLLR